MLLGFFVLFCCYGYIGFSSNRISHIFMLVVLQNVSIYLYVYVHVFYKIQKNNIQVISQHKFGQDSVAVMGFLSLSRFFNLYQGGQF